MPDAQDHREHLAFGRRPVWLPYLIVAMAASTLPLWPYLLNVRMVPDRGDPVFSAWRIARISHQLATDPANLLDGNIFFPQRLTLTYSDATLLQSILGAPVVRAGADPLIVSNVLFLAAFPACAAAFFYAGWYLTSDARAAMITGILGGCYPFHFEHYSHLELQWFMFVPLAFVAMLKTLEEPSVRNSLVLGACVGFQWLSSLYIGVMLVTWLVPVLAIIVGARRRQLSRRHVLAASIALTTASLLIGAIAVPYMKTRQVRGDRSLVEINDGSARLIDYTRPHRRMTTHGWRSRVENVPERELFPGMSPIALATAGLTGTFNAVSIAVAASGALAVDWSLGMNGVTYPWLHRSSPVYKGIRVPARFALMVGCSLVLLSANGAHRLISKPRSRQRRNLVFGVLTTVVLIDLRQRVELMNYWPSLPGIYSSVTSSMVLAEFPIGHEIDYMYFSTTHWARLLTGYSGFVVVSADLAEASSRFPEASAVQQLKSLGATHLTYNCAFERSETRCLNNLRELDMNPVLERVASVRWQGSTAHLYQLR